METHLIIPAAACLLGTAIPVHARLVAAPDLQMKAFIDELTGLGGKPLETLSTKDARKQPSPVDAVKKRMAKEGKTGPEPIGSVNNTKMVSRVGNR